MCVSLYAMVPANAIRRCVRHWNSRISSSTWSLTLLQCRRDAGHPYHDIDQLERRVGAKTKRGEVDACSFTVSRPCDRNDVRHEHRSERGRGYACDIRERMTCRNGHTGMKSHRGAASSARYPRVVLVRPQEVDRS
jgi:hypothetical protein